MGNNVFQSPFTITSPAIVAALGYTPANKAGDTFTGAVTFNQGITVSAGAGAITFNNSIGLASGSYIGWSGQGLVRSVGDGVFKLSNGAETNFDRLQFGGSTSSFPAIKRYQSAALFQFRTADDAGFVGVELGHIRLNARTVAQIGAASSPGACPLITSARSLSASALFTSV